MAPRWAILILGMFLSAILAERAVAEAWAPAIGQPGYGASLTIEEGEDPTGVTEFTKQEIAFDGEYRLRSRFSATTRLAVERFDADGAEPETRLGASRAMVRWHPRAEENTSKPPIAVGVGIANARMSAFGNAADEDRVAGEVMAAIGGGLFPNLSRSFAEARLAGLVVEGEEAEWSLLLQTGASFQPKWDVVANIRGAIRDDAHRVDGSLSFTRQIGAHWRVGPALSTTIVRTNAGKDTKLTMILRRSY